MHRVRMVLTQISSIEPVGAIKSSLSDLTGVTAAFVPPRRERRSCSSRSHLTADRYRPLSGSPRIRMARKRRIGCRAGLAARFSFSRRSLAIAMAASRCRRLALLITCALIITVDHNASGKALETFFENSRSGRPNSARSLEGPPKHRLAGRLATWRPAGGFERNDEFPGAGQQARVLRRDGNALAPGRRQEAELMRPGPVRDQEPQLVNASRRSRLVPQRVGRNLMSGASQPDRPDRMPFAVAHDRDNRDVGEIRRVAGDDRGAEQREREGREDPGRPSPYADIGPQFGEPGDFARRSRGEAVHRHPFRRRIYQSIGATTLSVGFKHLLSAFRARGRWPPFSRQS